jgi:hypothetical protein
MQCKKNTALIAQMFYESTAATEKLGTRLRD